MAAVPDDFVSVPEENDGQTITRSSQINDQRQDNTEQNRVIQRRFDILESMSEELGICLTDLVSWTDLRRQYVPGENNQNLLQRPALEGIVNIQNNRNQTRRNYERLVRSFESFGIQLMVPPALPAQPQTQARDQPPSHAWLLYVRDTRLWRFIIEHYQCWRWLMVFVTFASVVIAPVDFGFFKGYPYAFFLALDCIIMSVFILDFFIQFIRINIKCETRKFYISIWSFIFHFLDVFTSLPWALWYKKRGGLSCRIITIVRIIQIRRFTKIFVELEKVRDHKRFTLFKMLQLNFILFFSAHVAGCIFYLIPTCLPERERKKTWFKNLDEIYPNFLDENGITRYSVSLYFSFTTITSVGYGDIHPIHISERIFNIFFKVFGVFILAYVTYEFGRVILKYLQNPPILAENPTADESRQNDQGDD